MLATPLPAPAERTDATSRGAASAPASPRPEDGRFAELLRQRRADESRATERARAAEGDDGAAGRGATDATASSHAAAASRAKGDAARQADEDDAARAEPARSAASHETPAAVAAPVASDEPANDDPAAPGVTLDASVRVALASQVDVQARSGAVPQTASAQGSGVRATRVAARAGADAPDSAQSPAAAADTAPEEAPTSAPAALPIPAEPNRAAPPSRGADASLPPGASPPPARGADIAPPAVTSVALPAPVASADFGELLAAQVSLFARDGLQQAELRLNPAEMGPIGVQIEIAGNEARINFNADQALTRDAIERALPELAAALRGEGLTLAGGGVFDRPQNARDDTPARADAAARGVHRDPVAVLPAPALRGFAPQGAVDLYA